MDADGSGPRISPCPGYADPADFARSCDADPLPDPPPGAAGFDFAGDLRGLRPAELKPEPGDGLWLAGQICDWIEIRPGQDSCIIRLHVASRHNEEMAQPGIRYPI